MRGPQAALAAGLAVIVGATGTLRADLNPRYKPEAERRNRKATEFYTQGRFDSALQLYQAAYDLYPEPRFLFNIALALEKTFDYEGCAVKFQKFLTDATDAPEDVRRQAAERLRSCFDRAEIPLRITSAPSNAAIFLGSGDTRTPRGRSPVDLKLPPGKHTLTAEMPGYTPSTQELTLAPGERPQLDFVLDKLSSLRVEADPSGAQVSIDDAAPEASPVVREVAKGNHTVRVTREGYEAVRRDVKVEAGQEVSLVLSLRGLARPRALTITADAPRALVKLDGVAAGVTPLELAVRPGAHTILVEADRRVRYRGDLTIADDRDLAMRVRLAPKRSRANRAVFWTTLGTAAASLAIGSYYGLSALDDQSSFDAMPSREGSATGEDHAESADLWFAVGAAFAGGAVGWHFLTTPGASSADVE